MFATPEWITKSCNQQKVQALNQKKKLALIAIDEAHLVSEWAAFRNAFSELKGLKHIMALSATATTEVEDKIRQLLRNPVTQKQGTAPAIIYTDFIADIGPIVSSLSELGIEAVGYHGEMDTASRCESHGKWKSGEVQIIVATKAFGMGIDKANIRNVINNGVPENVLLWAQELGRAGRDGQQTCATILYRRNDISHANAWVLNNLQCKEHCSCILKGFSNSGGTCRHTLLEYAGDECFLTFLEKQTLKPYQVGLVVMYASLRQAVTLQFKTCAKNLQCSVNKLVDMELRSMIKSNGHYSVYGVFLPTKVAKLTLTVNQFCSHTLKDVIN